MNFEIKYRPKDFSRREKIHSGLVGFKRFKALKTIFPFVFFDNSGPFLFQNIEINEGSINTIEFQDFQQTRIFIRKLKTKINIKNNEHIFTIHKAAKFTLPNENLINAFTKQIFISTDALKYKEAGIITKNILNSYKLSQKLSYIQISSTQYYEIMISAAKEINAAVTILELDKLTSLNKIQQNLNDLKGTIIIVSESRFI